VPTPIGALKPFSNALLRPASGQTRPFSSVEPHASFTLTSRPRLGKIVFPGDDGDQRLSDPTVTAVIRRLNEARSSPLTSEPCEPPITLILASCRLPEAAAEHAVEVRHIAKASREGDIDDREMQAARVGQHRKRTLKPAFHEALGERLSRLLEQLLDVSPRQVDTDGDWLSYY
jgi:hypothetical protein